MRQNFFTEQELMTMPLGKLRRLDITTPEEEARVQKVVDARVGSSFEANRVSLRKDLDIQNPDQEARWDRELAQRIAEMKPQKSMAQIKAEDQPMVEQTSDVPMPEPEVDEVEMPAQELKPKKKKAKK